MFYMFANYQDNNILHEDDGDYEVCLLFGHRFFNQHSGELRIIKKSVKNPPIR